MINPVCRIAVVVLLALPALAAPAAKPAPPPRRAAQVPPAADLDPAALQWAVRACVAQGVAYLTNRAATDANGWVVPPIRTHRLIGYTNQVLRYSERATPLYEYESYTVYERRPGADSQSARTLKPVVRQRIKRVIDPEGGPKHLYRDENGPIVRETRVPVYERTGPDRWAHGTIGQNAMALYALLGAGVSPQEPVMSILAEGLVRLVNDYGVPDATWDLAWLTAGLSRWPDITAREAATACASKLLDGQILDGQARGLWGPACINIPLLAVAYQHEQDLAARQAKTDLAAKEKPDSRARVMAASDAASDLLLFQRNMKRIAMLAMAFDQVDAPFVDIGDEDVPGIQISGLPQYIFNQNAADLESTSLALFALREAAEASCLPRETWRPKMEGAVGVPRPEQADAILARTANALKNLQLRTGDWHACNLLQPVSAFNKLARMVPGLPVDPRSFAPLPSPQTPLATLQGYAALVEIGRIVGFEKALGRFRSSFMAGLAAARRQIGALPDRTTADPIGGRVDPCEAGFFGAAACDVPGTRRRELQGEWARLAFELAATQHTNGAWHARGGVVQIIPTSMQACIDTLPRRDDADPGRIMERGAAHLRYNWRHPHHASAFLGDRPALATCHALLFLLTGSHPPFLTSTLGGAPFPAAVPEAALAELAAKTGVAWRHTAVDLATDDPLLGLAAPALFLGGTAEGLGDAPTRIRLANYVMGGGIVIALADAASAAGTAFFDTLVPVIAAGCGGEGGGARDVAGEQTVLGDLAGRLGRPLTGMTRPDGSLAALMLPMADRPLPASGAFSASEAARVISTALRRNLDDNLLTPAFSHQLGDLGAPSALLATALQLLRAPAPKPAPPAAPEPAPVPPSATPAATPATPAPAATAAEPPSNEAAPVKPPPPPEPPRPPAADEVW